MIIKFKDIDNYQINVSALNHTLEKQIIVPKMNVNTGKPNKFPGPKWDKLVLVLSKTLC